MPLRKEDEQTVVIINTILLQIRTFLFLFLRIYSSVRRRRIRNFRRHTPSYSLTGKLGEQINRMRQLFGMNDTVCRNNLRMPIDTFQRLCFLLENVGGLRPSRNVSIPEQVAMFLSILAHHKKNVTLQTDFMRSGYTISTYFNRVLKCLIKIHSLIMITPQPVPEHCNDHRWKYFKGSLGALDGTYVRVRVRNVDKPRYRNRKGDISVNVLAVCDRNMNFIFLLTGWEGSAADSRVLRDAVSKPVHGLKVPTGQYYLVDSGYTNGPGFLAPFRGVRYHLHEYGRGPMAPQNYKEYFNLKHAKARNVIERAFGILKSRWGILRSPCFYDIFQQNLIIMACCLLHNFIRTHTDVDPEEANVPEYVVPEDANNTDDDFIDTIEPSDQWTNWRENLAQLMYNELVASHVN